MPLFRIVLKMLNTALNVKGTLSGAIEEFKAENPDYADIIDKLAGEVMPKFDALLNEANVQTALEKTLTEFLTGDVGANPQHPGLA